MNTKIVYLLGIALALQQFSCSSGNQPPLEEGSREEASTSIASLDLESAQFANYIHAPGGVYAHQSCFHEVSSGSHVDASGNVRDAAGRFVEQVPQCEFEPVMSKSGINLSSDDRSHVQPPATNGWVSAVVQPVPAGATTWVQVSSFLTVPSAPLDKGALNYYFNGLENSNVPIIQPVLEFGPGSPATGGSGTLQQEWTVSDYLVYNGRYSYSAPIVVHPGDRLLFEIYISAVNNSTDYTYRLIGTDQTTNTTTSVYFDMSTNDGGALMTAWFPAVHESYNDVQCESAVGFFSISQFANVNEGAPRGVGVSGATSYTNNCYPSGGTPACHACPAISQDHESVVVY